ncbi:MAG: hypothetical protein KJ949_02890, partial [Nanoarchaeota archaeon]|nr:hypothetical protein [Nanoarchaeota archaeon]
MKKINKKLKFAMIFLIGILFAFNFVSALSSYSRSNPQYTSFDYTGSGEFESFNSEMCREGQDFIIQIAPGGCTPAIVRSDLLEEQNVPVFCQLSATQINPLIKVEAIKSISFTDRELSRDVASVNFHPSRAALSLDQRTNFQPMMDNIGYVVLTLKQNPNESALENCEDAKLLGLDVGEVCWVEGNLTARIFYDIENAYGIGAASFYLPEMNDADWEDKYTQYGFWDGRGFLRAESVGSDQATISIYSGRISSSNFNSGDARQRVSTVTLQKGELSPRVYLPNFDYCLGNFQLRLTGLENPDTRARLNINGQIIEVAEREKFLENRCEVKKLSKKGLVQDVEIYCREDDGGKTISFTISPKINLTIDGNTRQVNVGDQLFPGNDGKFVYLAYAGTADGSTALENLEIRLLAIPENKNPLSGEEIVEAAELARNLQWNVKEGGNAIFPNIGQFGGKIFGNLKRAKNWFVYGENFGKVKYGTSEKVYDHEIEINNFAGPQNDVLYEDALEYYKNALDDYDSLETSYAGEKIDNSALEVYGENALDAKIQLAKAMGQERDMIEFCKEFEENYPDSKKPLSVCTNAYLLSSSSSKEISVLINGRLKSISFENIYEPSKNEYSAELLIRNSDGKTTPITLAKDQIVYLDDTSTDFIQLISLEQDSAKLMVSIQKSGFQETKDIFIGGERVLQKDIPNSFGSAYNFVLEEVNLKQAAKISVIPNINNQETSSEFKFKVGVEKRSDLFKLSPEKTKDMIKALDKNLKTWEDISKTLTTTVETMKSACLLTGITLTFKNLISNAGGQGIARYNVMRGHGGWYEKCTDIVNDKSNKITSIEQCFNVYEKNIEGDVDKMYEIMKVQNENIKETQKKYTTERILLNDILDTAGFGADFSKQVSGLLGKSKESVLNPRDSTKSITMKEISELLTQSALEENVYTLEQLRDIELYMKILEDPKSEPSLVAMAKENLYYIFEDIKANSKEYESSTLAKEESEKNGINTNFLPHTSIEKKVEVYEGATE